MMLLDVLEDLRELERIDGRRRRRNHHQKLRGAPLRFTTPAEAIYKLWSKPPPPARAAILAYFRSLSPEMQAHLEALLYTGREVRDGMLPAGKERQTLRLYLRDALSEKTLAEDTLTSKVNALSFIAAGARVAATSWPKLLTFTDAPEAA